MRRHQETLDRNSCIKEPTCISAIIDLIINDNTEAPPVSEKLLEEVERFSGAASAYAAPRAAVGLEHLKSTDV